MDALQLRNESQGSAVQIRREIEAGYMMALSQPRDEAVCTQTLIKTCQDKDFAEIALYSFPRGGSNITGPSVILAREFARLWKNIRYGARITELEGDTITVEGFATDLETNTTALVPSRFKRLVYRKFKGWIEPDERQLREKIAREIALCERNAILKIAPKHLIDKALKLCQSVQKKQLDDEIKKDGVETIKDKLLTSYYNHFRITKEKIENYLGEKIEDLTPDQVQELRKLFASLRAGTIRVDEVFIDENEEKPKTAFNKGLEAMNEMFAKKAQEDNVQEAEDVSNVQEPKDEVQTEAEQPEASTQDTDEQDTVNEATDEPDAIEWQYNEGHKPEDKLSSLFTTKEEDDKRPTL